MAIPAETAEQSGSNPEEPEDSGSSKRDHLQAAAEPASPETHSNVTDSQEPVATPEPAARPAGTPETYDEIQARIAKKMESRLARASHSYTHHMKRVHARIDNLNVREFSRGKLALIVVAQDDLSSMSPTNMNRLLESPMRGIPFRSSSGLSMNRSAPSSPANI